MLIETHSHNSSSIMQRSVWTKKDEQKAASFSSKIKAISESLRTTEAQLLMI